MIQKLEFEYNSISGLQGVVDKVNEIINVLNTMKLTASTSQDAIALLRELFYMRTPLGEKISDLVSVENEELWKRIYETLENIKPN